MSARSPQRAAPAARRAPPAPLTARGSPAPFLAPPRAAFCAPPSVPYLKQKKMGDLNSFMMLFFDNFSSLLGILAGMISCPAIATSFSNPEANFTDAEGNPMAADDGNYYTRGEYDDAFFKMVFTQVCPGIGCALLFGNIWYAMMAAKLSTTTGREDHTALPYGINTVSYTHLTLPTILLV